MNININSVPRLPNTNVDISSSNPHFPLKDSLPRAYPDTVSQEERTLLTSLEVDENKINELNWKQEIRQAVRNGAEEVKIHSQPQDSN